jgi:hypothetical protein
MSADESAERVPAVTLHYDFSTTDVGTPGTDHHGLEEVLTARAK